MDIESKEHRTEEKKKETGLIESTYACGSDIRMMPLCQFTKLDIDSSVHHCSASKYILYENIYFYNTSHNYYYMFSSCVTR